MNAAPLLLLACFDLLVPGYRGLRSEIVLEVPPALASWCFVVAPQRGFDSAIVEPGRPAVISAKYGTRVWAFSSAATVPPRFDDSATWEQQPASTRPLGAIDQVPAYDPTRIRRTTFRVLEVSEREVRLEFIKAELLDAEGRPVRTATLLLELGTITLAGALGLFLLSRRR